jgi:hypothetical protein
MALKDINIVELEAFQGTLDTIEDMLGQS